MPDTENAYLFFGQQGLVVLLVEGDGRAVHLLVGVPATVVGSLKNKICFSIIFFFFYFFSKNKRIKKCIKIIIEFFLCSIFILANFTRTKVDLAAAGREDVEGQHSKVAPMGMQNKATFSSKLK